MKFYAYCLTLALWMLCLSVLGQAMQPYGFIENRGQIHTQDGSPAQFVFTAQGGLNVQVHERGLSYDAYQVLRDTTIIDPKIKTKQKLARTYGFHRVDIDFPGSNPQVQTQALNAASDYLMYYPGEQPAGIRVQHFQKIRLPDLYPHIDLELCAKPGTAKAFEYNFILHPGADLSQIKIRYRGALGYHFHPEALTLKLAMGEIKEHIPASYWTKNQEQLDLHYRLIEQEGETLVVGFEGEVGQVQEELVIDPVPSLNWSTYFGSLGAEFGNELISDGKGLLYFCGYAESLSNIATRGVYQSIQNGETDALIAKFNTKGQRIWASYFGGARADFATGIQLAKDGTLLIVGTTESRNDIASPGYEIPAFAGVVDVFLAKFTTDGARIWSRYWGGPDVDWAFTLTTIPSGDIIIGGSTHSDSGIAAPGQLIDRYSFWDAYLARFSANGQYLTSTYLGGGDVDSVDKLQCDDQGNIYVLGNTNSINGIIPRNSYQRNNAGKSDIMLWKLNANFNIIWSTYCGGSGEDTGLSLVLDGDKNLYFTGISSSPNYPLGSNTGFSTLKGGQDAHVTKFSNDGQLLWATYLGGAGGEYGYDLKLDPRGSGAIFVSGGTNESPGFIGGKGWQTEYGGGLADAFLAKLDPIGQVMWSTYYGGSGWERFNSLVLDTLENIYAVGFTTSPSGMSTINAQQNFYGGEMSDILLTSFKDCYAPLAPQNLTNSAKQRICGGTSTTLKVRGEGIIQWFDQAEGGRLLGEGDSLRTAALWSNTTFYVQDSVCGRSRFRTAITVQVDPRPDVDPGLTQTVCAGSKISLSGKGAIFYLWDGGVINGFTFIARETRRYTVVGTGNFGCRDTAQVLVNVLSQPEVSAGPDRKLCPDEGVVLQGTGALRYTWDRGVVNGQRFVPSAGGVYTLIGENNAGCKDTASMTITLVSKPTVDAGPERQVCAGDTLRLQGSGALTYDWDGGIKNNQIFRATQSGVYTVIGYDANNCRDTAQVNVVVKASPEVDAGADQALCPGEWVVLKGTGAAQLQWDGGVVDGQPFRPFSSLTYTLVGRNTEGCTDTAQVKITLLPQPQVSAGPDRGICAKDSVRLEGSGASMYLWDFGVENGRSFRPDSTRTYTLIGIAANQCRDTAQVTVRVSTSLEVDPGPDRSVCSGEKVTLSGVGAKVYSWSDGVVNGIPFVPTSTRMYTLYAEDENGCRDTAQVQIVVHPRPRVDAGTDRSVCEGDQTRLEGKGAITYTWDQNVINNQLFKPISTATYTVIGRDANNCSDTAQVKVQVNPVPKVELPTTISICAGETVVLKPQVSGGTGAYFYRWGDGSNRSTYELVHLQYNLTQNVRVTDELRCQATAEVSIIVNHPPAFSITGPKEVCPEEMIVLEKSITAGRPPYRYTWQDGQRTEKIEVTPAQTTTYTLIVEDVNECRDTGSYTVEVLPQPNLRIEPGTFIRLCTGIPLEIKASGADEYIWRGPSGFQSEAAVLQMDTPLEGRYDLIGINSQGGCSASTSLEIVVVPRVLAQIEGPTSICAGETLVLSSLYSGSYQWSTGAQTREIRLQPTSSAIYQLTFTGQNECQDTAQIKVTVQEYPKLTLAPQYQLKLGKSVQLVAGTSATNYQWAPTEGLSCTDCPDPELSTLQPGRYCVTASNGNCRSEACTEISIDGKCQVYMPNAFSPNGDQINDSFCAFSPCIREAQLWIYDRWGGLVFQTNINGTELCWDGTKQGREVVAGTYVYVLRGVDVLGQVLDLKGTVNLLR